MYSVIFAEFMENFEKAMVLVLKTMTHGFSDVVINTLVL